MIRHTVLFTAKPNTPSAEIEAIFKDLHKLEKALPGIIAIIGGACIFGHDSAGKHLFTHGFSIDFKDQASYDAFLSDPVTHPVKGRIIEITVGGYNNIIGFNFY